MNALLVLNVCLPFLDWKSEVQCNPSSAQLVLDKVSYMPM